VRLWSAALLFAANAAMAASQDGFRVSVYWGNETRSVSVETQAGQWLQVGTPTEARPFKPPDFSCDSETDEQAKLMSQIGRDLKTLDLEWLRHLQASAERGACSRGTVPIAAGENKPAKRDRFYLSPDLRRALFEPEGYPVRREVGIVVDLDTLAARPLACGPTAARGSHARWSPDGRTIAWVMPPDPLPEWNPFDRVVVLTNAETSEELWRSDVEDRISDLAWARGSDALVVLTCSSRIGFWPLEVVAALAGHPVSHDTYSVRLLESGGRPAGPGTIVMKHVTDSWASLCWQKPD
jgi:hypothetical protein